NLTVSLAKGRKDEFQFIGWRADHLAFFATDARHRALVVELTPAYPDSFCSGETYRFPDVVPCAITGKQFRLEWSSRHRRVLRRWRDAKAAEVPSAEKWQIDRIDAHFQRLVTTSLLELLDPIEHPYALEDFWHGRWADEMGEDFRAMLREATEF